MATIKKCAAIWEARRKLREEMGIAKGQPIRRLPKLPRWYRNDPKPQEHTDRQAMYIEAIASARSPSAALRECELDRDTVDRWGIIDPEFKAAHEAAIQERREYLQDVAIQRGISESDFLLNRALQAWWPEVWGDKREIKQTQVIKVEAVTGVPKSKADLEALATTMPAVLDGDDDDDPG